MTDTPNHEEAHELALMRQGESNLARCYLDLASRLPLAGAAPSDEQMDHGFHAAYAEGFDDSAQQMLRSIFGKRISMYRADDELRIVFASRDDANAAMTQAVERCDLHGVTAQGQIDGPRRGPLADGSQTPNDAAAIPCAKAGGSPAARGYCHAIVCACNQGKGAADCSNWEPNE